jgi:urate oxidase
MNIRLTHNAYGKHKVRVSKIKRNPRDPAQHEFIEASVNVTLQGDLEDAYTSGDNRNVVATDTCRNTVYVVAKEDPFETIESFGIALSKHFLAQYSQMSHVLVELRQHLWHRLGACGHGFSGCDNETPTAQIELSRGGSPLLTSGIDQLMIAKTTQTGFKDFHRDQFRTLPDADDRILATVVTAAWQYSVPNVQHAAVRARARQAMLDTFLDHYSRSVQETLMLMGRSVIDTCDEVASIQLTMPNKHHIPFNLDPFGLTNNNDVFVVTDEPYGYITATVTRQVAESTR